jgi:hypothetical protein
MSIHQAIVLLVTELKTKFPKINIEIAPKASSQNRKICFYYELDKVSEIDFDDLIKELGEIPIEVKDKTKSSGEIRMKHNDLCFIVYSS